MGRERVTAFSVIWGQKQRKVIKKGSALMTFIKVAVFIISLLALPILSILIVLYIMIDMVRGEQIREENREE